MASEPSEPPAKRTKERVNLPWVLGSWTTGVFLVVAAFAMEHFYRWVGVSLDTMVSIGSALFLAGVLFFLQRRFVVEVQDVVIRAAASAADARIDERVRGVDARLDELDERMDQAIGARSVRQDTAVRSMDVPTFESVANALASANKLGALAYDHVTVQASRDMNELGLDFSWGVDLGDGRFGHSRRIALAVRARVYADERSRESRPVIETAWDPSDFAEQVGLRLREQLEQRGRWRGDGTLDWPMALSNLQRSLDVAIRSRRRDGDRATIEGALFELVGEDWAITDVGLECPSHGFVLHESEFPERNVAALRRMRGGEADQWHPAAPDWVDAALWDELVRRGRNRFPIQRGPLAMAPTWIGLKEGPGEATLTG